MRRIGFGMLAIGAVALAACGSSGYGSGSGSKSSTTTKAAAGSAYGGGPSTTRSAGATGGVVVAVRMTSLGNVLTDASGQTLYLYQPDGTSTTSKVPANLQAAWPPLVAPNDAPRAGSGASQGDVTVATQPGGAKWVAYHGHLLYTFSGDQAAGDTNGQGLGGVWFAVSPQGDAVTS
jgi:predicted lipoprotein with Yx(FWY)xxD motif